MNWVPVHCFVVVARSRAIHGCMWCEWNGESAMNRQPWNGCRGRRVRTEGNANAKQNAQSPAECSKAKAGVIRIHPHAMSQACHQFKTETSSHIPRGASRIRQDTKQRAMHLKFSNSIRNDKHTIATTAKTHHHRHTTESSYSKQAE